MPTDSCRPPSSIQTLKIRQIPRVNKFKLNSFSNVLTKIHRSGLNVVELVARMQNDAFR